MGLFGFGKKKTSKEILAEGRAQYVKGDLSKAFRTLHGLAVKGDPKACYYIGKIYLEAYENPKEQSLAQPFLVTAAKSGQTEAAQLLARKFGIRDCLPQEVEPASETEVAAPALKTKPVSEAETPVSAPKAEPASEAETPVSALELEIEQEEDTYLRGKELMEAQDWEGGIRQWTLAARQGSKEALKELTQFYVNGYNLRYSKNQPSRAYINYDKAIEWGSRAMGQGVDVASDLITAYQEKGQSEEAIALGEVAAEQGMDVEWRMMDLYLDLGRYKEAIFWGERYDAKKGETEAKEWLEYIGGSAFDKAIDMLEAKEEGEALTLFEKAAELGNVDAQVMCGHMYRVGEGTPVDMKKAFYWTEKAARQGNAEAQRYCGLMYSDGKGTVVDKSKALYWTEKAAKQGDVIAQLRCSSIYGRGEGTTVDKSKAFYWTEKAAEQGDAVAQFGCGVMCFNGDGTAVDKAKALYWYEKAAEQGDADAQFECGIAYLFDNGDKSKAKMWFQKAADQTEDKEQEERIKNILREYF